MDDGIGNFCDNCPAIPNSDQADSNGNGVGDACEGTNDSDGDGIPDVEDNCPDTPNANQADTDNDGIGNKCDNCRFDFNPDQTDSDGDGIGDDCDNTPLGLGILDDNTDDLNKGINGPAVSLDASPNPFQTEVNITFWLPTEDKILLEVMDLKGSRITNLQSGYLFAGEHQLRWDGKAPGGSALDAGIYLLRLQTSEGVITKRIVLMR
jgi:hypothetical protein